MSQGSLQKSHTGHTCPGGLLCRLSIALSGSHRDHGGRAASDQPAEPGRGLRECRKATPVATSRAVSRTAGMSGVELDVPSWFLTQRRPCATAACAHACSSELLGLRSYRSLEVLWNRATVASVPLANIMDGMLKRNGQSVRLSAWLGWAVICSPMPWTMPLYQIVACGMPDRRMHAAGSSPCSQASPACMASVPCQDPREAMARATHGQPGLTCKLPSSQYSSSSQRSMVRQGALPSQPSHGTTLPCC